MKEIKLKGSSPRMASIELISGHLPYIGVWIENKDMSMGDDWYYLDDRDLYRLEKAINKCRQAMKKKK